MAARRRGEDIIDFGMGNPDGPTPAHIVEKLVDTVPPRRHAPATRCRRASRGCAARSATGTSGATTSTSIPRPRRSSPSARKEGIAHLALATLGRGDTVLVPNPSYPIHIYGPVIAGADIRHVPMTPDVDFFAELEQTIRMSLPEAEDADRQLPGESDGAVRRAAVLRAPRRARTRARHLGRARPRLRRHRVRRLEGAVDPAGAGRARRRGRVLHDVEELQHGGLARRLHGRQPRPRRPRSRASRAITTTARSRRSRWRRSPRSKVRRTASREIAARYQRAARRAVQGAARGGLERRRPQGVDVRVGAHSRAVSRRRARSSSPRSSSPTRRSPCRRASASASSATATCASR